MTENLPMIADVFYRGDRSYIQGSLIVSKIASMVVEPVAAQNTVLKKVLLKRICNSNLEIDTLKPSEKEPAGEIVFGNGETNARYYFTEVERGVPPRVADDVSRIVSYSLRDGDGCVVSTRALESFDDVVSSIIETVKRLISDTQPGSKDIWFTALNNSDLVVAAPAAGPVSLEVSKLSVLSKRGRQISNHAVKVTQANGDMHNCNVIFTFLSSSN